MLRLVLPASTAASLTKPGTGAALALDGEIFRDGGAQTGRDAAGELLSGYLGASFGDDPPQGAFGGAAVVAGELKAPSDDLAASEL